MRVTFDPAKRAKTLAERGLDFADAEVVFAGVTWRLRTRAKTMANPASSVTAISKDVWSSLVTSHAVRVATFSA
jgi:uncharacterized DUF497 family protein